MFPNLTIEETQKLLPLVRAELQQGIFGTKAKIVCVNDEAIITARCRVKGSLSNYSFAPESIRQQLRRVKETRFSDIQSVVIRPGGLWSQQATVRISELKKATTIRIPHMDCEHLASILRAKLGDKVTLDQRVPIHGMALNAFILMMLGLAIFVFLLAPDYSLSAIAITCSMLPLLALQIYDHVPLKFPWLVKKKAKQAGQDRSGRKPFRSRFIGWFFKILAAVCLLGTWALGGSGLWVIPCLLLLYLGHLLAQVPPQLVGESDKRAPILYLRSFFDDRQTTLMPYSRPAIYMGIQPPRYLPSPWRYILLFHPIRVLRILFGMGVDTSEEQLALFFRKLGPFVAIGKPGETFASPGASRMYVTNDEWQNVVLEHLRDSQIVLLQPAQTEGVWWEVEKTLSQVEPQKVLICLVNFHLKQNDYEKFRLRAERFLRHPLPRHAGYTRTPAFIYFDQDWHPCLQEVSCRSPVMWPLVGEPVDLKYTLQPFLNSVAAGADAVTPEAGNLSSIASATAAAQTRPSDITTTPREPRGISIREQNSGLIAYLFAAILIGVVPGFVTHARSAAQRANQLAENPDSAVVSTDEGPTQSSVQADSMPDRVAALNSYPKDAAGWKQRGLLNFENGDFDQVIHDMTQSIELGDSDAETVYLRGVAYSRKNEIKKAMTDYQHAVELDETYDLGWNNIGSIQLSDGKFAEAIETFSRAIELQPDNPIYISNRAMSYMKVGKLDEAISDFKSSLAIDPRQTFVLFESGNAHAQKQLWVDAIKHYNTVLQLDPEFTKAYWERHNAYLQLGEQKSEDFNPYEMAIGDMDALLKRHPDDQRFLIERAAIKKLDGQLDEAIAELTSLLETDPALTGALNIRAETYASAGEYVLALADFEALIKLQPDNLNAEISRVATLQAMNKIAEAILEISRLAKAHPENAAVIERHGTLLYSNHRYADSLETLAEVLKLRPDNLQVNILRGQIYANLGQYDSALDEFQRVTEAQPNLFDPQLFAAFSLVPEGKWDEFDIQTERLKTMNEDNPNPVIKLFIARLNLMDHRREKEDWSQQADEFQKIEEFDHQSATYLVTLGALQVKAKAYEAAAKTLEAVTGDDPLMKAGSQVWLSVAQANNSQTEQAEKTIGLAREWIEKECPLSISEGQAVPENFQWWQRVEVHRWLQAAESLLSQSN